ncbi:MAG: cell division protein SepF [Actinobacteria bacterium HGW-Actinobacteria-2]|nr:MAG: cell division protein SepF [Actinobacteria bacterium HGW-Actinobacteria-2]
MADGLRKAAVWLGLVSDEEYTETDIAADEATEQVPAPRELAKASDAGAKVTELETRRPPREQTRVADISRIITVHPRTYNEARTIGENFRDGVPVIMNVSDMEEADAKRLVDFSAGLIFGLRGSIERITSKVFLLSPHNVSVTAEDKERLAGGFFNQS